MKEKIPEEWHWDNSMGFGVCPNCGWKRHKGRFYFADVTIRKCRRCKFPFYVSKINK